MHHEYIFIIDGDHFYSYNVRRYRVLAALSTWYYFIVRHCPIFASIKHEMINTMYQRNLYFVTHNEIFILVIYNSRITSAIALRQSNSGEHLSKSRCVRGYVDAEWVDCEKSTVSINSALSAPINSYASLWDSMKHASRTVGSLRVCIYSPRARVYIHT